MIRWWFWPVKVRTWSEIFTGGQSVINRGQMRQKDLKPQSCPRNIWLAVVDRLPPTKSSLPDTLIQVVFRMLVGFAMEFWMKIKGKNEAIFKDSWCHFIKQMLGFIFGTGLYIANNEKIRLTSKKPAKFTPCWLLSTSTKNDGQGTLAAWQQNAEWPHPLHRWTPLPPVKPKKSPATERSDGCGEADNQCTHPKGWDHHKVTWERCVSCGKDDTVDFWFVRKTGKLSSWGKGSWSLL